MCVNRYVTDDLENELNRLINANQNALILKQGNYTIQYNILNVMANPYLMAHYEMDVN